MAEIGCPSCGTSNPGTARFCGSCGEPLERTCPSCGTANPLANRFCGSCGIALVPVPERPSQRAGSLEERKVVTMLFADLTASTEMSSRLDPEDLRSVLRPFFDAMAGEIGRYGGTVEKFIGDAVVAAFGAPVAHEDDPGRAIRCGLAMQRRLAELNTELSERAGGDLAMRIGINTGEVLAHSIEEGIVTGEAVNIAARLQSLARPGRVVVGERTYRDAHEAFAFADLGEVSVKGIDRPLRVYEVQREESATGEGRERVTAPFVGRDPEMELLRLQFRRTVAQSNPNLITIVGPPGIGKSRLSDEAARAFEAQGAHVVRGRCLPYGDGLTYWPLAEILRADAGILDSDPAEETIAKARERLDPRFPGEEGMGVANVLLSSIGVELATDPLAGAEREAAQRLIARSWQQYLESLAGGAPLVALIDDVHWADPSLLELLESVVARASGPILVLCMARPDLFERRAQWGGGLSNATTISLSALSPGDGSQLIEHLLGGHAPAEVVEQILGRSEGNPFFAAELLRMMIEDTTIARRDDRWELVRELPSRLPDTVQGVIASRIDLLAPEEKRAIQDASVIGRSFWPGGVARLEEGSAERAIEGLVAKGLVVERDTSTIAFEREFIFNHVLTRDVAYGSIPKARRATAHAIVGAWMEEGTTGRAEEFAEILAHHFSLAGDRERSGRYALIAGQRLLRVFAAEEAIAWFDRAMDTEPADPRARGRRSGWRGGWPRSNWAGSGTRSATTRARWSTRVPPGTPRARRGLWPRSRTRSGSWIATTRAARSCPKPSNGPARSASATWKHGSCTRPGRCGSAVVSSAMPWTCTVRRCRPPCGARTWRGRRSRTTDCARRTSSSGRSRTVSNTACSPTRSSASSASDRWWRTTATWSRGCSASSAGPRRRWRRRTPRSRRRTRSATSGRRGSGCSTGRSCTCRQVVWMRRSPTASAAPRCSGTSAWCAG